MRLFKPLYVFAFLVMLTSFGPPILTWVVPRPSTTTMSLGEIIDIATPIVLVTSLCWLVTEIKRSSQDESPRFSDYWPFSLMIFGTVIGTSGQGMHLSANSLSHFLQLARDGDIYRLNNLYDSVISHYLWHGGSFLTSFGLALYQFKHPYGGSLPRWLWYILPVFLYSATFTFASIQGETLPILIPFTVIGLVFFFAMMRKNSISTASRPVLVFILSCYILMLLGWLVYALYFQGFPRPLDMLQAPH